MYFNSKTVVFLVLIWAVVSCKTDPYTKGGILQEEKPDPVIEAQPVFSLSVLDRFELKEGVEGKLYVSAALAKGNPLFSFEGLPEGAVFEPIDANSGNIVWKPSFSAANSESDPSIRTRTYPVRVDVTSDVDSITYNRKEVLFTVIDTPRKVDIVTLKKHTLKEGVPFKQRLVITSEDYPEGPFQVELSNIPQSVKVHKVSENEFSIEFTPAFDFTSHLGEEEYSCGVKICNDVFFDINVRTASGIVTTLKDIQWVVEDVRVEQLFTAPLKIEQGPEVNFSVSAVDMNYETKPTVIIEKAPQFGKLELMEDPVNSVGVPMGKYATTAIIKWTDIPLDRMGTIQKINLRSCVWGNQKENQYCTSKAVEVHLKQVDRPFPLIARGNWSLGKINYAQVGETKNYTIPVSPGEGETAPVKVSIEPPELASEVKWVNGTLSVKPLQAGLKAFSIVAVSAFNVKWTETFYFEALAPRAPTIILSGLTSTAETAAYLKMGLEIEAIPAKYQELDERFLYGRKNLLLTTETLQDKELLAKLPTIKDKFESLIIISPLLGQLPNELLAEFSKAGVAVFKRLMELPAPPAIGELVVQAHAKSNLSFSKAPVGLLGALTPQSSSPAFLQLGGITQCKEAFAGGVKNDPTRVFLMGVKCKRENQGKLVVLGFELPDSKFEAQDIDLVKTWYGELLK